MVMLRILVMSIVVNPRVINCSSENTVKNRCCRADLKHFSIGTPLNFMVQNYEVALELLYCRVVCPYSQTV